MLWSLLLLAAVTAAACYWHSRRRLYQLAREIPSGLKAYPIIGHGYMFLGTSQGRMSTFHKFSQVANQQGGLSHFWLANRLFIFMTDPKAIELVSKACLDKDEFTMKFLQTFIGNCSIFAPVSIWHPRRKILSPFFKLTNLKQIVNVFHEQSTIMTNMLQSQIGNGDFPIWKYFTQFTFDTVCETTVGVKMNSQVRGHWALDTMDEVMSMVSQRILQPWLHPDIVYHRLPVYRQFQKHKQRVYAYIQEILRVKRQELETHKSQGKEDDVNRLVTFLETAILSSRGAEKGYTDIELCEEAIVLVVAGNDTSAVGSCFTAVMLSRHPDVQEKVYQELWEVFGDSDRAVTPEDLLRLKYMEAVIKESLRLYPPGPVIVRELRDYIVLPSGTTLVEGTSVMISIWGTHRNPAYWGADADQFRPERFLEGPLPHPAMFIPFSYSVRGCIGSTYAMMSMKTALANLLRRFRLLPPANMAAADLRAPLAVKFDIMMKAVDNFVVRIAERK